MNSRVNKLKIVAIMGPTGSGKSAWAIKLAKQFNGVIISADSRQIYKGLDVATAKVSPAERKLVPHYMLDVVDPDQAFSVADYQAAVYRILEEIRKQNTKSNQPILPFLVGGTGLYIEAVAEGLELSIAPDRKERQKLEAMALPTLVKELLRLDPETTVDLNNKVRVVRAIEIARSGRKPGKLKTDLEVLRIGIEAPRDILYGRIDLRAKKLPINKFVVEVIRHPGPLSLYTPAVRSYVDKKIDKLALVEKLAQIDRNYARKQMTWLRRDKQIKWVSSLTEAQGAITHFIGSR